MGLICAAPTAGSCGILPGVLLAAQEEYDLDDAMLEDALLTAAAIGSIIAKNATLAGARGRLQAECGSAAAHGGCGAGTRQGRRRPAVFGRCGHCLKKRDGLSVRPCGGFGYLPLRQAQRFGRGKRRLLGRYGFGGH